MSIAPGSGSGTGYSRISNGLPAPWNTAILAVSAMSASLDDGRRRKSSMVGYGAPEGGRLMKIAILDDYQDTIRTLDCFKKVAKQDVTIWKDHTKDVDTLAKRLADTEVLVCIRERTPIRAPLLDRLDRLKMVTQVGVVPNIDVPACTRRGVIVSSSQMPGRPSFATAELTWGLVIAAVRRIPQGMIAMRAAKRQACPIGTGLGRKTEG